MNKTPSSIGIFDSGVGGLTVFRQLAQMLPSESLIYLGDTARVPYGSKSSATVIRYAKSCAQLLLERGIKMLVVACNTASAFALETLQSGLDIPVIGVVEPGAQQACSRTHSGRIGVIGTRGTISSGIYEKVIMNLCPEFKVFSQACPLFVPLVEEGWTTGEIVTEIARKYLQPLLVQEIDTLVLGCTHYPLLASVIASVSGEGVSLIDSASATANVVKDTLLSLDLNNLGDKPGEHLFLVSDSPETFREIGERFLGVHLRHVEWVDVQDSEVGLLL